MSKCVCEKSSSADPNRINTCTICEENLKRDVLSVAIQFVYAWMDVHKSDIISADSTVCANCGKGGEGDDGFKFCAACKMVKYCSRECQIAHRLQHKKECKKRASILYDEELFKLPPQKEACPICFLVLPSHGDGYRYFACCGKTVCCGCIHAVEVRATKVPLCPFCRTPAPSLDREIIKRTKKRIEANDALAILNLGCNYNKGGFGLPLNYVKALELWHKAGELGCSEAYYNIGLAYMNGRGVERNMKNARYYWELAAMIGHVGGRYNLGVEEENSGNMDRALKHYMIAVEGGLSESLDAIKELYMKGHATKDDYAIALRTRQAYLDEIKSTQRDAAAAHNSDEYRYY